MVPEGGAQYLTKEQLAAAGPNYLVDEIRKRRREPGAHEAASPARRGRRQDRRSVDRLA